MEVDRVEFIGRSAARITDWFYGDLGESESDEGEDGAEIGGCTARSEEAEIRGGMVGAEEIGVGKEEWERMVRENEIVERQLREARRGKEIWRHDDFPVLMRVETEEGISEDLDWDVLSTGTADAEIYDLCD